MVFKMNPIQAAPDRCEGIIDDEDMTDVQNVGPSAVNKSTFKPPASLFSVDSIDALKEKAAPQRFQVPP